MNLSPTPVSGTATGTASASPGSGPANAPSSPLLKVRALPLRLPKLYKSRYCRHRGLPAFQLPLVSFLLWGFARRRCSCSDVVDSGRKQAALGLHPAVEQALNARRRLAHLPYQIHCWPRRQQQDHQSPMMGFRAPPPSLRQPLAAKRLVIPRPVMRLERRLGWWWKMISAAWLHLWVVLVHANTHEYKFSQCRCDPVRWGPVLLISLQPPLPPPRLGRSRTQRLNLCRRHRRRSPITQLLKFPTHGPL
jgi:hypothetical protein